MSAKRYFQLSYIWPVALPVAILALPGNLVPGWITQLCKGVLQWAGIPFAVFAAVMIFWSRNKEANSVRRSTYISPVLFLPAIAMYLVIAGRMTPRTYPSDAASAIAALFIYGFLVLTLVLTLGYAYVGAINFVFVILRSCGAFWVDEWLAMSSQDPDSNLGSRTWVIRQGAHDQSTGGLVPSPSESSPPGSPYSFVGWEDEKSKGSSTACAVHNSEAPPASIRETERPTGQAARSPEAVAPDPLRAASLAVLVPLLVLAGFALFKHHRMGHWRLHNVAPTASEQTRPSGGVAQTR